MGHRNIRLLFMKLAHVTRLERMYVAVSRKSDLLTRNVLNGQLMMAPGRQGADVLIRLLRGTRGREESRLAATHSTRYLTNPCSPFSHGQTHVG
jgi:hypothetical protein